MNGLYEPGKEFQVAAQLTEGKCFGSRGERVGDLSMHRHRQCKTGAEKQEGECEYRQGWLEWQTLSFLGRSPEMSHDQIKH